jgi:hypothetical protein
MREARLKSMLTALVMVIVLAHPDGITAEDFCDELERRGFPRATPAELGLSPGQVIHPGEVMRLLH